MAYQQNQNQGQRPALPPLVLTPAQIKELVALTQKDGYTPFDALEIEMMATDAPAGAKFADFRKLVYLASSKGLNPLQGDVHLEYRNDREGGAKAAFVTHLDGNRKLADATGEMDGFSQLRGQDENGWYVETTINRKGRARPFVFRAYFKEFCQTKSGGEPTYIWSTKSYHMTAKCSANACLKWAFPREIAGLTTEEEAESFFDGSASPGQLPADPAPAPYVVAEKPAPAPPPSAPAPAPPPAETPAAQALDPKAEYKAIAGALFERTKCSGKDIKIFCDALIGDSPKDPANYLKAVKALDAFLTQNPAAVDDFKFDPAKLAAQMTTPEPLAAQGDLLADPAVSAVKEKIREKLKFGGELLDVAAVWCADWMRDADQLRSYLEANDMLTAPPGRVEAFLAITRHVNGRASDLMAFFKKSGTPLSEVEAKLSKMAGYPIRFAPQIEEAWVSDSLTAIFAGKA